MSPEHNPLDKALDEIVEKIDKVEKTCKKLIILIKKSKILGAVTVQNKCKKICVGKTLEEKC